MYNQHVVMGFKTELKSKVYISFKTKISNLGTHKPMMKENKKRHSLN